MYQTVCDHHEWTEATYTDIAGNTSTVSQCKKCGQMLPTEHSTLQPTPSEGAVPEQQIIDAVNKAVSNSTHEEKKDKSGHKSDASELKVDVREREETLQYIRNVMVNNNFQHPDQLFHYWNDKRNRVKEMCDKHFASDPLAEGAVERKEEGYREFNLNEYILVNITEYGWEELSKTKRPEFIEHCIKAKKQVVNGTDYYKLQAHFVIDTFGSMLWLSFPAPLHPVILIPNL